MSITDSWKRLLREVHVDGQVNPLSESQLDAFEAVNKIKLPLSYREFCKVFGPGSLQGQISLNITAPGRNASAKNAAEVSPDVNIEALNKEIWSTRFIDLEEYCPDPELVKAGLFFGVDIYTHHYFWNTKEITDTRNNEMAVYVIFREWAIHRLAETFEAFIFDVCLTRGIPDHDKLSEDPPLFEPK